MKKRILGMFVILIILNITLEAQSKQETIKFIEDKINNKLGIHNWGDGNVGYQKISFSGDKCIFNSKNIYNPDNECDFYDDTFIIPISKLDPTRVEEPPIGSIIQFHITEDKKEIKCTRITVYKNGKKSTENELRSSFYFWTFDDDRVKVQLKKAFIHLIKLSGGKGELF